MIYAQILNNISRSLSCLIITGLLFASCSSSPKLSARWDNPKLDRKIASSGEREVRTVRCKVRSIFSHMSPQAQRLYTKFYLRNCEYYDRGATSLQKSWPQLSFENDPYTNLNPNGLLKFHQKNQKTKHLKLTNNFLHYVDHVLIPLMKLAYRTNSYVVFKTVDWEGPHIYFLGDLYVTKKHFAETKGPYSIEF